MCADVYVGGGVRLGGNALKEAVGQHEPPLDYQSRKEPSHSDRSSVLMGWNWLLLNR